MIPEAGLPSPQDDEEEEGSRQNQDDRLAEMHEAMYGKAQGASSGIEIALETTTSTHQGSEKSEKSGERPQLTPHEISDDENESQKNPQEWKKTRKMKMRGKGLKE